MQLFDLHCDTLYECYETGAHLRDNTLCIDRKKASGYSMYTQVFALFCGTKTTDTRRQSLMEVPPARRLDALLETARAELSANADWLTLCRDMEDWEWAKAHGKHAAFLSIEGAELLTSDAHVQRAYDAGVRMVSLSWNGYNPYACGAMFSNDTGLSDKGKALVRRFVEQGILMDVSHLSEAGFWDVCLETEAPFAASHSNSRACCDHLRNLTDLQFSEIVRRGGLAGINLYSPFLRRDGKQADLSDVLRHVEHFLSCGGESCLAMGADLDGCERLPEGIDTVADMEKLAEYMLHHNYLQRTVDALLFGNAHAFFNRMLKIPA